MTPAIDSETVKITDELIRDMETLREFSLNRNTTADLYRDSEHDMYFGIGSHCVDRMEHTRSELERVADEIRLLTANLEPGKEKASGTKRRIRYHEYNIKDLGNASGIYSEIFAITQEIVHGMKILREFSGNRMTIRSELERIAREIKELLTPKPMPNETAYAIQSDAANITNDLTKTMETMLKRLGGTAEDFSLNQIAHAREELIQISARVSTTVRRLDGEI